MARVVWYATDTCADSGGENINVTTTINGEKVFRYVTFNWPNAVAPSTSENIVVTLDSAQGANSDVPLLTIDPSATSATSVVWRPDGGIVLGKEDQIKVTYTNTDDLEIAVVIAMTPHRV